MADETRGDSTKPKDPDLHKRAMDHADEAWKQEFENIDTGRDCQRFYAGGMAQWDPEAAERRKAANRPVLTMNRIPGFVRQLTGEVRQNPPSIKVLPAKDGATVEKAEIFNGLIRNIEQQSLARAAYTKATENAAQTGIGAWRVVTQYSADDAFEQDIRIKRINDPFAVLIDPLAQMPDKSDMRYGFVFEEIAKAEFERRYPGKTVESLPANVADQSLAWRTVDTVKIGEYWYRDPVKKTLQLHEDDTVSYAGEEGDANPSPVVQKREVKVDQIKSCIVSGKDVLEGPFDWPGRYIPIAVVVGEEIYEGGRVTRKGMVHDARDPQKVYNYTRTAAVEAVAMQPKSPYVATADMVSGYENQWATAGTDNRAVLIYKADPKAPGMRPERSAPPIASQGLDVQSQIAVEDLKGVTGIYDASLGSEGNETSGRAILARQSEGDTGTYHFIDNLSFAINYTGRILVDLIPKIYDSTRIVRTLGEDGSAKMVKINEPTVDNGQEITLNDLSAGEYDVTVTTGPSYATKRAEATAFMTEFVRSFPEVGQIAGDIIVKNMDVPGADEIAKRIRMAKGLNDEGEPIQQEPPPPDPATAAKAIKDAADADKTKAETVSIELQNAGTFMQLQSLTGQVQQLMQMVQQLAQGGEQGAQPPPAAPPGMPPEMQPPPDQMTDMPATIEVGNGLPPTVEIGAQTA